MHEELFCRASLYTLHSIAARFYRSVQLLEGDMKLSIRHLYAAGHLREHIQYFFQFVVCHPHNGERKIAAHLFRAITEIQAHCPAGPLLHTIKRVPGAIQEALELRALDFDSRSSGPQLGKGTLQRCGLCLKAL